MPATRFLPLYEAKMIHHFDDQWATYGLDGVARDVTPAEKVDPDFNVMPRYWVAEAEIDAQLGNWSHDWLLGWRDIARATDERTVIAAVFPRAAVGNKLPLILGDWQARADAEVLGALLSSFACDFAARQKVGGSTLNFFLLKQFPVPSPDAIGHSGRARLEAAIRRLEVDRSRSRAAIDAEAFHLYGLSRESVDHILDTFPIVRRKDEAAYGEYRTKRLILSAYDVIAKEQGVPTLGRVPS